LAEIFFARKASMNQKRISWRNAAAILWGFELPEDRQQPAAFIGEHHFQAAYRFIRKVYRIKSMYPADGSSNKKRTFFPEKFLKHWMAVPPVANNVQPTPSKWTWKLDSL
jgi:hypothetical protein